MTVVQTCRHQERSVIDFFEQSLVAIAFDEHKLSGLLLFPHLIPLHPVRANGIRPYIWYFQG
ncbi:MAG: hypothetical protein MGG11_19325 [Trichodesmium sp. MAG_R03]|nr:hypothetical protein [Trichodesmium sp. MAG_R03]